MMSGPTLTPSSEIGSPSLLAPAIIVAVARFGV